MSDIAVGSRLSGLTHLQVGVILDAALFEAGVDMLDVGPHVHIVVGAEFSTITFRPEASAVPALAELFHLTQRWGFTDGDLREVSGDWGGVRLVLLYSAPAEAVAA